MQSSRSFGCPADLFNFGKVNMMFEFLAKLVDVEQIVVIDALITRLERAEQLNVN